jgi:uncharacterized membrane protein YcaP (DUF421 family)
VFATLTAGLNWAQWRFPRVRPVVNGLPVVIMRDGQTVEHSLRQQRLSDTELMAAARQQGIRDLRDVDLAVLETDGRISFFSRQDDESGAPQTQASG